jgi:hypothetical protein
MSQGKDNAEQAIVDCENVWRKYKYGEVIDF